METSTRLPGLCTARGHLHPVVCLELCPPRQGSWGPITATVHRAARYRPDFLTMTDTGTSRGHAAVQAAIDLWRMYDVPVIAHLTCVDRSRDEFLRHASELVEAGIRHLLVLRGDPVRGTTFTPHPEGFRYASEAINALRKRQFPFTIGAACFPADPGDLANMARKAETGVEFFVAQVGLESSIDGYRKHTHAAALAGVSAPILPCHLAVTSADRLGKIGKRCGVNVPEEPLASLARRGDTHVIREMAGFARSAWVQGAPGLHLSTFNDPNATERFLEELFEPHVARRRHP